MINQLLAGVHIAAAAEAMAWAYGPASTRRCCTKSSRNSAGTSWMFQNRVPHILAGDYTPLSAVNIFVKDLGIVLDTANEVEVSAAAHGDRAPDVSDGRGRGPRRRRRFRGNQEFPGHSAAAKESQGPAAK